MTKRQTGCWFKGGLAAAFCSRLAKISRCSNARVTDGQGSAAVETLVVQCEIQAYYEKWEYKECNLNDAGREPEDAWLLNHDEHFDDS
jgi:hypothetical protein